VRYGVEDKRTAKVLSEHDTEKEAREEAERLCEQGYPRRFRAIEVRESEPIVGLAR
jgi:hypothetical protein